MLRDYVLARRKHLGVDTVYLHGSVVGEDGRTRAGIFSECNVNLSCTAVKQSRKRSR